MLAAAATSHSSETSDRGRRWSWATNTVTAGSAPQAYFIGWGPKTFR
jgi:hypothetical protein